MMIEQHQKKRTFYILAGAVMVALTAFRADVGRSAEDDAQPAKQNNQADSLDDDLLDGFDSDLFDGLDESKSKGSAAPEKPAEEPAGSDSALDARLADELGEGEDIEPRGDQDPFQRIGRRMQIAGQRLADKKTAAMTQQVQKQIVDDLAALIDQIKKSKRSSGGQSRSHRPAGGQPKLKQPGKQPGDGAKNPANDAGPPKSTDPIAKDEAEQAARDRMQALIKEVWGQMPEKVRQEMPSPSGERFLPKYQRLIEDYFQRLAEEGQNRP